MLIAVLMIAGALLLTGFGLYLMGRGSGEGAWFLPEIGGLIAAAWRSIWG